MSQNGQTNFKILAAFAARFLKCVWPFGALCIKGLINDMQKITALLSSFPETKKRWGLIFLV